MKLAEDTANPAGGELLQCRCRRRRSGHLPLARGRRAHRAQLPQRSSGCQDRQAGGELPLQRQRRGGRARRDQVGQRPRAESSSSPATRRATRSAWWPATASATRRRSWPSASPCYFRGRIARRDRRVLPRARPVARARGSASSERIPYQVVGGMRFFERAEIKGPDRLPAPAREPGQRRRPRAHRERAVAQDRRRDDRQARGLRQRVEVLLLGGGRAAVQERPAGARSRRRRSPASTRFWPI